MGLHRINDLQAGPRRGFSERVPRDSTCGWRIVISPGTGHVTHPFAGLARVVLVVADFKGIRDG